MLGISPLRTGRSIPTVDCMPLPERADQAPTAHRPAVVPLLAMLLALTLALLPSPKASAEPDDLDTATQSYVEAYTDRHGLPGAAYAVVEDGELVASGAAGDITATTPLSVGSLSKSFTSFAVLQLVDAEEVDLDSPITQYLPSLRIRGADTQDVTVRMLLSHTSGFPNPLLWTSTGSLEGDVALISEQTAASAPGTDYLYSNLNYWTLALLVQEVSGEPFDEYLSRHIFEPLGMDDTTSVITVSDRPGLDAGHVTAYGTSLPLSEMPATVGGAGGVISTAEDMAAWLGMQQRGGVAADGTRLLSAELIEESHRRQENAGTYGLGWQHTSTADPARIGHDGSMTRYSSRQDLVPSSGVGTVVLLDSYTTTYSHPFSISTGLITIAEGGTPELGVPTATIIDLVLLAITLLALTLGVRGLLRSRRWAERRAHHRWWRRLLRLLPQAVLPALTLYVFVGLTAGPGNPARPVDALGLWPAASILLLVGGIVGAVLIAARLVAFRGVSSRA